MYWPVFTQHRVERFLRSKQIRNTDTDGLEDKVVCFYIKKGLKLYSLGGLKRCP